MVGEKAWPLRVAVCLIFLYLLSPMAVVLPLSFSNDSILMFPPESWGARWYRALFHNDAMLDAFWVSIRVATAVTLLSLLLGAPAAYALSRCHFAGREAFRTLFTAPLLLPSIVLGLAILLVFVQFNLLGTMFGLIVAHLIITTPYVVRIISTSLAALPPAVEEAATMAGASPLRVFFHITLPLMLPGVMASVALSFMLSFDEVVLSLFVTGPSLTTLPIAIFSYVEGRMDPLIAAISVVLIAITLLLVLLIERSVGLSKAIGK